MVPRYPGRLDEAVTAWIESRQAGGLRRSADLITSRYRRGGSSAGLDLAAYLAVRLPATFAANQWVLRDVAERLPSFSPQTLLDVGTGPGTATWAAMEQWTEIAGVQQIEASSEFADLAEELNRQSGIAPLENAALIRAAFAALATSTKADLVLASYVLAEQPRESAAGMALQLWQHTNTVLVIVEPGTPEGFSRIRAARDAVLNQGGFVLAPCTHQLPCPMAGKDWCHFKVRVQRSRAHMHAKSAHVPFEDEAFSWIAFSRAAAKPAAGRVIAPVNNSKAGLDLRICAAGRLQDKHVASRDKGTYKLFRKVTWGGIVPDDGIQ